MSKEKIKIVFCILGALSSFIYLILSDANHFHLSGNRSIYYGIPSLILVTSLLMLENNFKNNNFIRFWVKLGEASYVMYLFHVHIFFFFLRIVFPKIIRLNSNRIIDIIILIFVILMIISISLLIYKFIDKPIQDRLKKIVKNHSKLNYASNNTRP
jgi:peptidoglycan/LPS O-acetylase OafA/YrhL